MKLNKTIKKLVALGTGVTMLGATILGGMAADLADYPNQYIKDGLFDGLMVVGAAARTEDVLGVVDIATSLQYTSKIETVINTKTGSTSSSLSGDTVEISMGSDLLEINERIGNVRETLTSSDMIALQGGIIRTQSGSTQYNQYLRFNESTGYDGVIGSNGVVSGGYVTYGENNYDEVEDYLYFDDNEVAFEYELEFIEGAKSKIENSNGDEITTGSGQLVDLEDENINILGNTYSIVRADVTGTSLQLTFLGGNMVDTLKERETKTYTVNGTDYEVTVLIIADSDKTVKFSVNGEVTKELGDRGDTYTLNDGTVIGLRDVMANEGTEDNGSDLVDFYIGANKLILKDTDYTDNRFVSGVKINEDTIEDARVKIKGTLIGSDFTLNNIKYRLSVDAVKGSAYIKEGEGLRQYLDEPEGMIGVDWDITYEGLTDCDNSIIEIEPSGDESYELKFTNNEDIDFSVPFVDSSNDNGEGFKYGSEDDALFFIEAPSLTSMADYTIGQDDYFVVNKASSGEKAFTHVLRFNNIDDTNKIISFDDQGSGSKEVVYTGDPNIVGLAVGDLLIGGSTYKVYVGKIDASYRLAIDLNGDGLINGQKASVVIAGGGILDLGTQVPSPASSPVPAGGNIMTLTTLKKNMDENDADLNINWTITSTGNEVDLKVGNDDDLLAFENVQGSDKKSGMNRYGTYIEENDDNNDANSLYIEYPFVQRAPHVYVTSGAIERISSVTGAGTVTTTKPQRIDVGVSVLDSTVTSLTANNLIVVGGPCVNTVSATLMGNPINCAEGFEEGKAIVKLFENGNKVAMLVAGYSAADTRRAAQTVARYDKYNEDFKGDEIVITGTGLIVTDISSPKIIAPVVMPESELENNSEDNLSTE